MAEYTADLYAVLEVERSADPDTLKKAYRSLARRYHPDANPDNPEAEARFKEISHAYEVLSDPERRAHYDRFGNDPSMGQSQGFDAGFGDIFEAFFGQMGGRQGGRRGPMSGGDAEVRLQLTLVEAAFGVQKDLEVKLAVRCDDCQATGAAPGTTASTCPECQGAGELRRVRQSLLGQMVTSSPCMRCQGMGQIIANPCPRCRGEGRIVDQRTLTVDIPAGVDTGSTLRLAERGPVGPRGGPAGSLFVQVAVAEDERFVRDGDDLHHEVHIGVAQAALGTVVEVPTLEGTTELHVARGTQGGAVHRVRGEGVTHLRGRGRGDLFVHVAVDTPTELSEREEALMAELAEIRGEAVGGAQGDGGLFSRIRSAFH